MYSLDRCPAGGCHLANSIKGGVWWCDSESWEDPRANIRRFGLVRRDSPEWRALYAKRQSIERIFKSMKESRRLEQHCIRGLRQVTLHAFMAVMTTQATELAHLRAGDMANLRWLVRKVA